MANPMRSIWFLTAAGNWVKPSRMTTLKTNQLKFVNYNVRTVVYVGSARRYFKDSIITIQIMRATKERAQISHFALCAPLEELPNDDKPHALNQVPGVYAHQSAVFLLAWHIYKISASLWQWVWDARGGLKTFYQIRKSSGALRCNLRVIMLIIGFIFPRRTRCINFSAISSLARIFRSGT